MPLVHWILQNLGFVLHFEFEGSGEFNVTGTAIVRLTANYLSSGQITVDGSGDIFSAVFVKPKSLPPVEKTILSEIVAQLNRVLTYPEEADPEPGIYETDLTNIKQRPDLVKFAASLNKILQHPEESDPELDVVVLFDTNLTDYIATDGNKFQIKKIHLNKVEELTQKALDQISKLNA